LNGNQKVKHREIVAHRTRVYFKGWILASNLQIRFVMNKNNDNDQVNRNLNSLKASNNKLILLSIDSLKELRSARKKKHLYQIFILSRRRLNQWLHWACNFDKSNFWGYKFVVVISLILNVTLLSHIFAGPIIFRHILAIIGSLWAPFSPTIAKITEPRRIRFHQFGEILKCRQR